MLLRVGVVLMTVALAFTGVVTILALYDEPMERAVAAKQLEAEPEPLVRNYLPERHVKGVESQPEPAPSQKPEPQWSAPSQKPEPQRPAPEPEPRPEPWPEPRPEREVLPLAEEEWPTPTEEQLEAASQPRYYDLPPGAVMGLTIEAMGIYDVPVFDSASQWAIDNGISHIPETSLPWSATPQRNVYLAGHRLGWPDTWSHLVFYHLDKLGRGDTVLLRDRQGGTYEYEVTEAFLVDPTDSWVMGQVAGRDMVTLQTCTPIPSFEKRLVVRADRV
jgi:sortase A